MEIPKVTRQVKLEKECELRIEVGPHSPLRLCLLNGTAEIFGTELPPRNWLTFQPRSKFAVFTWYAATVEIEGFSETEYTSDDTPMISYVNVHAVLDARRRRARSSPVNSHMSQGPRVIVVGPNDSGKTTLSKMLLSWAARLGWKPTFVDLDVRQGSITVPGCIAAIPVESPIDPVNGIPLDIPLVYFNGDVTLRGKVELYKLHMNELAKVLERQCSANAESRAAGMVINTMGWKDGDGYELLLGAIDTFNANVVLVLGHDKLWIRLKEALTNEAHVDVVKLQKSGGVVSRDKKFRQEAIVWKTREYFYGLTKNLSPHSNTVSINDLCIYRTSHGPAAPLSALPVGLQTSAIPMRLSPISVTPELLHSILAVSLAKEPGEILSSNVAGFIWISNINMKTEKITYLAPSLGSLPGKYLIAGSLTWYDQV